MDKIKDKLKAILAREGFGTVREIIIEQGPDSTGDEALFVWLLLDDKVRDDDLDWNKIEPLVTQARTQMRQLKPEFYPYVRVRRVREWHEMKELAA